MADEPAAENGYDVMWKLVVFLVALFIIVGLLGRITGNSFLSGDYDSTDSNNPNSGEISDSENREFKWSDLIPKGNLSLGEEVVTVGEIKVRNAPAGEIIGNQDSNAFGKIVEGPVDRFNTEWWRIDFEKAPDGWVDGNDLSTNTLWARIVKIFTTIFDWIRPFAILLSILILFLIIWVVLKKRDLAKLQKKREDFKKEQKFGKEESVAGPQLTEADLPVPGLPIGEDVPQTENVSNKRWENIQSLINSYSANDWRQAIIEADVILEEMLKKMGYKGAGVGEMLKQVEKSDFITLNKAWDAHKVRNTIAHRGSDYVLSRDEAEKAISNFQEVFEEFYYI